MNEIYIVGSGYVGLANGVALASNFQVTFVDVDESKLKKISAGKSPIEEAALNSAIRLRKNNIRVTSDLRNITTGSLVLLALPTDYDPVKNYFDTSSLEHVLETISKIDCTILIKSTIPVGFTALMREKYGNSLYYSPEFLREGRSLHDAENPDRVIISPIDEKTAQIEGLFRKIIKSDKTEFFQMNSTEAECVKLFANTFLAARIALVNELDEFLEANSLDALSVFNGIGADCRIGHDYFNPSFGFGGYCFPKDTRQALATLGGSAPMVGATVAANQRRAQTIAENIAKKRNNLTVGFYRLTMKFGSDNIRMSASLKVLEAYDLITSEPYLIYEPLLKNAADLKNAIVVATENELFEQAGLIVANRIEGNLSQYSGKIYTRDLYNAD